MRLLQNFYHCETDSFPIMKDFSDETGSDINKCDFLTLYDECQYLKDLPKSMHKLFSNCSMQDVTKIMQR